MPNQYPKSNTNLDKINDDDYLFETEEENWNYLYIPKETLNYHNTYVFCYIYDYTYSRYTYEINELIKIWIFKLIFN